MTGATKSQLKSGSKLIRVAVIAERKTVQSVVVQLKFMILTHSRSIIAAHGSFSDYIKKTSFFD